MREQIEAMKQIWTKDIAKYHGQIVDLPPMQTWPKPVQQPWPSVIVGGAFRLAARRAIRYGDGILTAARCQRIRGAGGSLPAPAATAAPVTPTTLPNAIRSRSRSIGRTREHWPAGSHHRRTNILGRMELGEGAPPTDMRISRTQARSASDRRGPVLAQDRQLYPSKPTTRCVTSIGSLCQCTKSLRSSPLRRGKRRETGSQLRGRP